MSTTMVAVVVAGPRNRTRVTSIRPLGGETLDNFAKAVARKEPGRYYVIEYSEHGQQRKKGDPLYAWHVSDGFGHVDWDTVELVRARPRSCAVPTHFASIARSRVGVSSLQAGVSRSSW